MAPNWMSCTTNMPRRRADTSSLCGRVPPADQQLSPDMTGKKQVAQIRVHSIPQHTTGQGKCMRVSTVYSGTSL